MRMSTPFRYYPGDAGPPPVIPKTHVRLHFEYDEDLAITQGQVA